jgi:hypothetical protein
MIFSVCCVIIGKEKVKRERTEESGAEDKRRMKEI